MSTNPNNPPLPDSSTKTPSKFKSKLIPHNRHTSKTSDSDDSDLFDGTLDPVYAAKARILNEAIQDIGMGRYQWALFFVAGFGWYADNLWPIVTGLILAPVVNEFNFKGPFLKLGQNVGLLVGAFFWGLGCDVWGRRWSFNITLFITAVFGIAAGGSPNSATLIVMAALWSVGVGGNLPVDSAVFLEFVPGTHQYLLTVLSIWWAFGQLIGSLIAWPLIANFSCPQPSPTSTTPYVCLKANNMGWRYFLYTMGGTMFVMWVLRFFVFHLYESPKYLMGKGKDEEAVEVLRNVAVYNGRIVRIPGDGAGATGVIPSSKSGWRIWGSKKNEEEVRRENEYWEKRIEAVREELRNVGGPLSPSNDKVPEPEEPIEKSDSKSIKSTKSSPGAATATNPVLTNNNNTNTEQYTTASAAIKRKLEKFSLNHMRALFATRKLAWSTSLLISLWALIGLAFPLYNSFVTFYLATRGADFGDGSTYITYRNQVILSVIGVPGALLAGYTVDLPFLGRRGTLALSTILTGVFLFASTTARTSDALLGWNCGYSFTSNVMYGVLYAVSPELFATRDRGTGNGLCATANRVFGVMAPIIALYANLTTSVPIFISGAIFIVAGFIALLLPFEPQGKTSL